MLCVILPNRIVNNYDWYKKLNVVDFLQVAGRNFRVGTMLSRTSVQSRLKTEEGMSLTEFTYQVTTRIFICMLLYAVLFFIELFKQ